MKQLARIIKDKKGQALRRCSGQATTELAIMGTVIIMLLATLVQQGFMYNSRQALEMYTFRKALQLSQSGQRGVSLTVARDVIVPSFFSGIARQRIQSSASVELNPWILWVSDVPQHVGRKQLLQIGEAMIRSGTFVEVPPTKMLIPQQGSSEWQWSPSVVKEIDSQTELGSRKNLERTSRYNYTTNIQEDRNQKTIAKTLSSDDTVPLNMKFERGADIAQNYAYDNWDGSITGSVSVDESTIPKDANLRLDETVSKAKAVTTPHH